MVSTKFKRVVTQKKGMGSVKQRSSVGEGEYAQTPQARVQTADHCAYGGKRQEERRTEDSVPESLSYFIFALG